MIKQLSATIVSPESLQVKDAMGLSLMQEPFAASLKAPQLQDFAAMLSYARSGLSAKFLTKDDCPAELIDDVVHIYLAVFVFPSNMELAYQTSLFGGEVGEREEIYHPVDFDAVCELSETINLDYLIDDLQITNEIPCFNEWGDLVSRPGLTDGGNRMQFDASHFSVYRVKGMAKGYKHPLTIKVPIERGYKVEDIELKFQATWLDDGQMQQKTIDLVLPECVQAFLNRCEDGGDPVLLDSGKRPKVFFSACTGDVLLHIPRTKTEEDE